MRKFQFIVRRSTVASIEYIGVIITTNLSFTGWTNVLYIATEIVASGLRTGEASAQQPEHTQQYVRIASTARPRPRIAQ